MTLLCNLPLPFRAAQFHLVLKHLNHVNKSLFVERMGACLPLSFPNLVYAIKKESTANDFAPRARHNSRLVVNAVLCD